jgi:hypothetical protein
MAKERALTLEALRVMDAIDRRQFWRRQMNWGAFRLR